MLELNKWCSAYVYYEDQGCNVAILLDGHERMPVFLASIRKRAY
jgi:hypothetical protein